MAGIAGKGGQKGRSGPPGNSHNFRHGARAADRHGVALGILPRSCFTVQRAVADVRRNLEAAVLEVKGAISVGDAALIATACRWQQVALLTQRLLRVNDADLKPDQKVSYVTQIAEASEKSDRAMKALGLAGAGASSTDADPFAEAMAEIHGENK